jgi:hypothetical protein
MRRIYVVPKRWMVIYEYEVPGGALNLNSTKPPRQFSVLSFGCFPGVWFILADVSEHSICSIFKADDLEDMYVVWQWYIYTEEL